MKKSKNSHLTPLPRREGEEDAERLVRERRAKTASRKFWSPGLVGLCFALAGCETANYAPIVGPQRKVEATKLERGRQLFVRRCIECHTLPAIWKYSREDWPQIVNDMSHRASLKSGERDAVIAYILAARKQM